MSDDAAIICEGLGKQYRIGERERYKALRDVLTDAATAPLRRLRRGLRAGNGAAEKPIVWALQDVSFEIKRGEVVGVIGRNGAGKSTLLKILSRITEPTTGCARIYGRIGSLLEVGTGFHPELTGRENIYLNGAILGMKKVEIARKFDEIVAFAEVEKFIDTPVKRYSIGMYLRLAFAVAAHMETEILLVDEVLAVGDAQFQKKCFEKFRQISTGGRTIVLVSHNMSAVRNVCKRGIVLHYGSAVAQGQVDAVIDDYLASFDEDNTVVVETEQFILEEVAISSAHGPVIKPFDDVDISVRFVAKKDLGAPSVYIGIQTLDQQRLAGLDFRDFETVPATQAGHALELGFRIRSIPLLPGQYQLEVHLKDMANHAVDILPRCFPFEIVEAPVYGGRKLDSSFGNVGLKVLPLGRLETNSRVPKIPARQLAPIR